MWIPPAFMQSIRRPRWIETGARVGSVWWRPDAR